MPFFLPGRLDRSGYCTASHLHIITNFWPPVSQLRLLLLFYHHSHLERAGRKWKTNNKPLPYLLISKKEVEADRWTGEWMILANDDR